MSSLDVNARRGSKAILLEAFQYGIMADCEQVKDRAIYKEVDADGHTRYYGFHGAVLRFDELTEESIEADELMLAWHPHVVPMDRWEKAIQAFEKGRALTINIRQYIIPAIVSLYADEDIAKIFSRYLPRMRALKIDATDSSGTPYKKRTDCPIVYFNNDGIVCHGVLRDLKQRDLYTPMFFSAEAPFLTKRWETAILNFPQGRSDLYCAKIFLNLANSCDLVHKPIYSEFELLVQKIEKPHYERIPENSNPNTFDYIRVSVHLGRYMHRSSDELKEAIRFYQKKILHQVLQRIKTDPYFEKYGVPLNCLRLTRGTLRKNSTLEFLFELKDLPIASNAPDCL